jgi:hypothetical protein
VPYQVRFEAAGPVVKWCYAGDHRFTDGFFDDTITAMLKSPFAAAFPRTTSLEELRNLPQGIAPSGFVFHMSRCGSTLISRLLAASPRILVMSEPGPLDAVIRGGNATRGQRIEWIRWMINALGSPRHGETHYVIKLDCWHMLDWNLLREAFPETPWLFVYRNPVEVLVSLERRPSYWSLPGSLDAARFGLDSESVIRMMGPRYLGRVLEAILAHACDAAAREPGALLNYRDLPQAVWQRVAGRFGIELTAEERTRLESESAGDAKNPLMAFSPDAAEKRRGASELIRQVCAERLDPWYERLEALRAGYCAKQSG